MRFRRLRSKPRTSAPDVALNCADDTNRFRSWVLSLPFVHEYIARENDTVRQFVIDCPPLDIRRPWLMMRVAQPGSEMLTFLSHNDGDVECTGFTAPCGSDPRHVEAAVLSAYQTAFTAAAGHGS